MVRAMVLETSCFHTEVALAEGQELVASRLLGTARKHARDVVPALKELVSERGWNFSKLDVIAVDIGPGSYTGLRVGLMTAKTIAYATGAALIGIDAMTVLAADVPPEVSVVSAIVDAQQGMIYHAESTSIGHAGERQMSGVVIEPAAQWADSLPLKAYVTGPALARYTSLVPTNRQIAPANRQLPSVKALWDVAWKEYQRGRRDDFWKLEPLYLRPSSAEQKWDRQLAEKTSK